MLQIFNGLNESTIIMSSLSIILFAGFLITRITKLLHLPNVSGYIIAGVIIGPSILNLIPAFMIEHMQFVSDIALAFIAFGVGKFFKKEVIADAGLKVIFITLCEALIAGLVVTIAMRFLFRMDWNISLILGAIATATAPASTMMTIRQYHAKGEFVNVLLQVVALDDVVCLLTFSIVVAVVNAGANGSIAIIDILKPIILNGMGLLIGFLCGIVLGQLLTPARSMDNRLILVVAMLLGISGLCACFDLSPLLSCMVFGATYINVTKDKRLFHQINDFTPPIMSLFFIISGMSLDVAAIPTAGVIGLGYFVIRIMGKYFGTVIGCKAMRMRPEITKYMGLALIPQAGVAIGLAFLGERLLPPVIGSLLLTIILSSSVLYEIIGPVCAKMSFFLSGTIKKEPKEVDLQLPISHIKTV